MAVRKSIREIEIKLRVGDAAAARRMLRRAGFRVRRRRVFESNVLYDTADRALGRERKLLRVRSVGSDTILTFKGTPVDGKHKIREELELELSDGATFARILERMGMEPSFRYEKYRTEFQRPGPEAVATLDETPIGNFVELEGPPAWIDKVAAEMGFEEPDYITASYARLYFEQVSGAPESPGQMAFDRSRESDTGETP